MKVFAVSDLHLPGNQEKPMDVFGGNWTDHFEKIKHDWLSKVGAEDIVLIAGYISWAMVLSDALTYLEKLRGLPGKKVFIRGNHDYWWSGITALRRSAPDQTFYFLQNDCVRFDGVVICGSRGWACPGSTDFKEEDEKIYRREGERFRLAFQAAQAARAEGAKLIASYINSRFAAVLGQNAGALVSGLLNLVDTNLSYVDFESRLPALTFLSKLSGDPAQAYTLTGAWNKAGFFVPDAAARRQLVQAFA